MNSDKQRRSRRSKSKSSKKKKSKSRSRSSSETENKHDIYIDNNLKLQLEDKPEILTFISRLQDIIKKQAKKIKKLKSNLKHYKKKSKTEPKDENNINIINNNEKSEPKSLVEEITEAAEKAVQQTGFVYEATSGMYYDFNSGYYYNAELGLYYDGNKGTYLTYNHKTQKYEFHSQVDVVSTKPLLEREIKVKRKKQHKEQEKRAKIKKYNSSDENENLEEGECSSSENDDNKNIKTNGKNTETESDISDQEIAISQSWPPCMRIIVKETQIEKMKVGSLYIITCDGGTVGREGNVSILIPDINVSKTHAEIKFDKDANCYRISDLGSQNGTILNGKRISEAKQMSQPFDVVHGSLIQFGSTKLLCHIHDGQKTCGHCEPGLIQAETTVKSDEKLIVNKNTQYKKELKRLKKKFGVETQENADLAPGYSDRAEERRKVVGSSTDKEKTQASSLEQSIAKENKGFKMLSKMGWSEGQSLGKDGSGLTEPVPIISNPGKTGLGSSPSFSLAMAGAAGGASNAAAERKSTVWKKTQQRYQLVQEVNLEAFKQESSSDDDEEVKT